MKLADSKRALGRWGMTWLKIGRANPWIRNACDPDFDLSSFYLCKSRKELLEKFEHGNWCLGSAFVLGELCFISQVSGGDEWLVIRRDVKFESLSARHMMHAPTDYGYADSNKCAFGVRRLLVWIEDALAATDEELRTLEYEGAAARRRAA